MPAATPVTNPDEETVATAVEELLQTPPEVASVREVEAPVQTVDAPDMTATEGAGLTVMASVATAVPQEPVTL